MLSFVFAVLFIPSFNVLSGYFYVALKLSGIQVLCLNSDKFRDTARSFESCLKSYGLQVNVKFVIVEFDIFLHYSEEENLFYIN